MGRKTVNRNASLMPGLVSRNNESKGQDWKRSENPRAFIRKTIKMPSSGDCEAKESMSTLSFLVGHKYKLVREVGGALGVKFSLRKGWYQSEVNGRKIGISCIVPQNKDWKNDIVGDTLEETCLKLISLAKYQKHVQGSGYDVDRVRLVFLKQNGEYEFIGVYAVSAIDFVQRKVIFRKLSYTFCQLKVVERKVRLTIEEEIILHNVLAIEKIE